MEFLKKRFGKKRLIIQAHLKAIIDLSRFDTIENNEVRSFLDTLESNLRSVVPLGVQTELLAPLLIPLLMSLLIPLLMRKMSKKLIEKFKFKMKDDEEFSLKTYLEFLGECVAVKDVEQQPIEHTPVRPDSLITPKYSSAALRASLADGKIEESK